MRRSFVWTDERTDGRTDGRTDRQTDGRTDGRTNGRTVGRMDGRTDERLTIFLDDTCFAILVPRRSLLLLVFVFYLN